MGGLLPDLAGPRGGGASRRRRRPRRRSDAPTRRASAAPTSTSTPSPGRHGRRRRRSSTTSSARTDLDVIAITDHERIDAAARRPGDGRATAACRVEVVVGEEVTTLGGHLLALFIERPIRPYRSLRDDDRRRPRRRAASPSRPTRSCPYPLCAQGWVLRRLLDDPDPARPPRRPRDVQPDGARQAVARAGSSASPTEHGLAHVGNSDAHALDGDRHRLDDVPGPRRPRDLRGAIATRHDRARRRPSTRRPASSARSGSSCASAAATPATRSPAGSAATARGATTATPAAGSAAALRAGRGLGDGGRGDEDRPRLPVHLPGARRRRPARPVPLREPPPARPRRPDHHRQPRPAARVGGRHPAHRRRLQRCRPTARSGR